MAFKFCSLASGSSGNCLYIETDKVRLLVDAGLSGKRIQGALDSIGVDPTTLDGILVTHEHKDHTKGVGILSRRFDLPIYANEGTWEHMMKDLGKIKEEHNRIFKSNETFEMGDLGILPFSTYHDANASLGYCFYHKNKKVSILTDTGRVDDQILKHIEYSNLMLIESNHDVEMVKMGRYPYFLKKRVLGDYGHLSNEVAGDFITKVLKGNNETVLLGHLSQENNFPELAYQTVMNILNKEGIDTNKDVTLDLALRHAPTKLYQIG